MVTKELRTASERSGHAFYAPSRVLRYNLRISADRMDDELVLLTSYFNLANGRRQDTADTFRVDPSLPSSTSPDGTAALYIVTEASTGGHMGPRARRMAADTVAWEYSTHSDEPPARRLKAALRAAHEEVQREFDGHVSVGASVIAVERDDIFLAQVAPGQVYVVHDESLHSIAASIGGSSPYARGLGSSGGPEISLFRDAVAPRDVIALCSSWFHRAADPEELRECFAAGSADDIAEAMLDLARQHDVRDATVVVIEAELASQLDQASGEPRQGLMEQVDMAVQALADVGRMLVEELRPEGALAENRREGRRTTGIGESSALTGTTAGVALEEPPGRSSPATSTLGDWNPEETSSWDLEQLSATEDGSDDGSPPEQATDEIQAVEPEQTSSREIEDAAGPRTSGRQRTDLDEVNSRLQYEMDMGDVIPPVQAFPDTSTEPSRIYATSKDIQAVNRRPRRFGGVNRPTPDTGAPVLRPGLADIDLRQPGARGAPPALIWASVAGIAVIAVLALFVYLHNRHGTASPKYLDFVRQDLALASSSKNPTVQDAYLAKARKNLGLAAQVGQSPATIQQWRNRLLTTTDTLHHITRAYSPTVLATFANGTEIATSSDALYVLDKGKNGVFSVPSTPASSPTEIVTGGESDSNFTVGKVAQLATSGTTALVLDNNTTLVRDTNGTKTATALQKVSPNQTAVGMANFGPDVYLLDPKDSQIWRYAGAVQSYQPQPSGFFAPNGPNIHNAVAFTLDDKSIYILESTGNILKFDTQANAQTFHVSPRTPFVRPNAIFTDVGLPYVWIADPGSQQIVQVDKNGHYVRAYVSGAANLDLSKVTGIAVPPNDKWLYVLTGTKVFRLTVVR